MENKRIYTLQGKLTLLMFLLVLTLLTFFFGNYYLANRMNQRYRELVDQHQLITLYSKSLVECRDALMVYSNSTDDGDAAEKYRKSSEALSDVASQLFEAFPDPYIENLSYLSEELINQGDCVITETANKNVAVAKEAYSSFKEDYNLIDKYLLYVQQSITGVSTQRIDEISAQQMKSSRIMLAVFCSIAIVLMILAYMRIRRIVRPIRHLTEMARLVMQNVWDLPQGGEPERDETGVLLTSFYHMVQTIREQIEKLKEQQKIEMQRKEEEGKKLQLEYRNVQLELKALQNQVNPHFLFNCLNMISKQAYIEDAPQTQHTTEAIARYLRSVLDQTNEIVTIEKEVKGVQNYLDIQSMRFGDRFQYEFECDPRCNSMYVPFMILQPLVENTFTHGIDYCTKKIHLSCRIERKEENVVICVTDDGPGMSEEKVMQLRRMVQDTSHDGQSVGIGLINVFRRMQLYFHDQVEIQIESTPYEKTEIRFLIPTKSFQK
ncbi:MAG: histidine kinase [Lachnospiraceae bacterium]|nr:histidine kinase [Robinsoniella sp.]MDY3767761.1 histidine kinase [Lachnospiraceae bacterium]